MQHLNRLTKWILCCGWLGLLGLGAGCGDNKSSLQEAEVISQRARQKPMSATSLSVSGEILTLDKIQDLSVTNNYGIPGAPLGGILVDMAKQMPTYQEFEKVALPQTTRTVKAEVSSILLYQKLKREAGDKLDEGLEAMAERDWREFVLEHAHGNDAEAEALLRSQHLDREQFKESHKRSALTQYYLANKMSLDRPIGHKEILDYFERQKDTVFAEDVKIVFRLIDLQPVKMVSEIDAIDRMAAALKLTEEIKVMLDEGADFGELARTYSHGHMARIGGLWPKRNPASLAEPYDVLGRIAEILQPGEISEPIIAADHVFIMKLEEREAHGNKPLAEVQPQIEKQISKNRKEEVLTPLNQELDKQAEVGDIDCFIKACLQEIYAIHHPVGEDFIGPRLEEQ